MASFYLTTSNNERLLNHPFGRYLPASRLGKQAMTRLSIDDLRSFSDRGESLPLALAEPVERGALAAAPLDHNAYYDVR